MPDVSFQLDTAELALIYDRSSTHQFNHGKILIGSLGLKQGERVLDVGTGTGRLGEYVADLVGPDGEVVGIDPLPLRIELAGKKGKSNFHAQLGRAEDLSSFDDASFDAVFLNSVFHWIEDKSKALSEAIRVLKPGGRIALNSADASRPHQAGAILQEIVVREGLGDATSPTSLLRLDAAGLRALLEKADFTDITVNQHTFVDFHPDADSLLEWNLSSTFGNSLTGLSPEGRLQLRGHLARRLEEYRTPEGIRLERYLVFATAHKR